MSLVNVTVYWTQECDIWQSGKNGAHVRYSSQYLCYSSEGCIDNIGVSSESMRRMRSSVGGVPLGPLPAVLAILISYCRWLKFAIGRPAGSGSTVTPQPPSSRHVSWILLYGHHAIQLVCNDDKWLTVLPIDNKNVIRNDSNHAVTIWWTVFSVLRSNCWRNTR